MGKANTGVVDIRGKEYKTVGLRVTEFREEYGLSKGWGIVTELVEHTDQHVIIRASVVNPEGRVLATGLAHERPGSNQINTTSALENCETSAIGRALANAGFVGSEYASADEVANAMHQQNERPKNVYKKGENPPGPAAEEKPKALTPAVKEEYEKIKALCLNCTKAELDEYAPRSVQTAPLPDKHRQFLTALLEIRRKQFELGDGQPYYMAAKGALLVTRLDLGVWGFVVDDALKAERIDADAATALKASIQRRLEERQEGVAA